MTTAAKPQTAVARRDERSTEITKDQRDQLRAELQRYAKSFASVLPKHLTPDRMLTLTLVAATKTPQLYDCTIESIALAVVKISQWGLEIGETAHLVPFRTKGQLVCTPIADWKGLIQMAINSGHVHDVTPHTVHEREHFVARYGLNPTLEHHPIFGTDAERGKLTHAYAVAFLRFNRTTFEVMSRSEIEGIRQKAPSKDSPAWTGHYGEMCKKTVVRRLLKRLPKSATLAEALEVEDAIDIGATPSLVMPTERVAMIEAPQRPVRPVATNLGYEAAPTAERDEEDRPVPTETVIDRSEAKSGESDAHSEPADTPASAAPSSAAAPESLSDAARWEIPAGALKGKKLGELNDDELRDLHAAMAEFPKKFGGTLARIEELREERRLTAEG